MSIINDQVKSAWSGAVNGFLLRLIQSPGTTIGGGMMTVAGIVAFFGTDRAMHWASLLTAVGGGLVGLNATSHGFVSKQSSNTDRFVKPADPTVKPPTPPTSP